jgi:hypothetical protein
MNKVGSSQEEREVHAEGQSRLRDRLSEAKYLSMV